MFKVFDNEFSYYFNTLSISFTQHVGIGLHNFWIETSWSILWPPYQPTNPLAYPSAHESFIVWRPFQTKAYIFATFLALP